VEITDHTGRNGIGFVTDAADGLDYSAGQAPPTVPRWSPSCASAAWTLPTPRPVPGARFLQLSDPDSNTIALAEALPD